ncbi:MAG: hypothetical protein ACON4U_02375 [Myxococcota bacterium]
MSTSAVHILANYSMTEALIADFEAAGISARALEPFASRLPLRTDGRALAWLHILNLAQLKGALKICRRHKVKWMYHWPQESWITKGDWRRVIIRLTGEFSKVSHRQDQLHIGTSAMWGELSAFPDWGKDFKNWPGSIGAIFQRGKERLIKGYPGQIEYFYDRKVHQLSWSANEDPPTLPGSAVPLKLILEHGRRRRRLNPSAAGMVFRCKSLSPADAFQVAGLLGTRLYGWQISAVAPGQIVHIGRENSAQFIMLFKGLKERLKTLKNIELELQIPIHGGGRHDKNLK